MKICTWNCRYGLTPEKAAHLCKEGYNADIYAIQEYDMRNNKPIHEIEKHLGQLQDKYGDGREYRDNAESGGDLGLALFSNTYRIERIYSNTIPYRYVVPYKVTCKGTNESFTLIHVWTKIADLEDRLKRQIAEFDNFRKRTEKEKSAMFDMGARHIIEAILPTIDNFERGLKTVPEDKEAKAFYDGMEMIYKQMLKVLSDVGVTAIDCLDKEFDLNLHNAVMHVEDEAYGNNIIIEEFQKGYKYKDTVIRHSMVKVAN